MQDDWGSSRNQAAQALCADDVCDYLMGNPSFLQEHDELLEHILPPDHKRGDKVEDFQRFMVARLQRHFMAIRGENDDLMDLMQSHLQRQNKINDYVLALLDTPDFFTLLTTTLRMMPSALDQGGAQVFLEQGFKGRTPLAALFDTGFYGALRIVPTGFVDSFLRGGDLLLWDKTELQAKNGLDAPSELFGLRADKIQSIALVRLDWGKGVPVGLLALGSEDPASYATGLATEQIEFLGAVLQKTFQKLLHDSAATH